MKIDLSVDELGFLYKILINVKRFFMSDNKISSDSIGLLNSLIFKCDEELAK